MKRKKLLSLLLALVLTMGTMTTALADDGLKDWQKTPVKAEEPVWGTSRGTNDLQNENKNGVYKYFFANGTPIKIENPEVTDAGAKVVWKDAEKEKFVHVTKDAMIFGGSASTKIDANVSDSNKSEDPKFYDNVNITMNGGTVDCILGGGNGEYRVNNVDITVNGGKIEGYVSTAGRTADAISNIDDSKKENAVSAIMNGKITINGGVMRTAGTELNFLAGPVNGAVNGYAYIGNSETIINGGEMDVAIAASINGYVKNSKLVVSGGKITEEIITLNRGYADNVEVLINGPVEIGDIVIGSNDIGSQVKNDLKNVKLDITHCDAKVDGIKTGLESAAGKSQNGKDAINVEYLRVPKSLKDKVSTNLKQYIVEDTRKPEVKVEPAGNNKYKVIVTPLDNNNIEKVSMIIDGKTTELKKDGDNYSIVLSQKNVEIKGEVFVKQTCFDESEKVPFTIPAGGNSTGTIKEITLVGGRSTLTENIESKLTDFVQYRLSGKDRYGTSADVAKEYNKSNVVLLASGEKYTDELTATVLADKLDAPIMLTRKDSIPAEVKAEINRLEAKKVILVGGSNSVSEKVEKELTAYTVERLGGPDRYDTAILVGNQVRGLTGSKTEAILVDGTNFPDAIAMTSMGVEQNMPILLTKPNQLPASIAKTIKDWNLNKVTIGGGVNSVSGTVVSEVKKFAETDRIAGADRYETSVLVAEQVYVKPAHAVVASGEVFPDAIVGAPYATKNGYPIVLSRGNYVPEVVMDYLLGNR